jgi:hypothetical protein
MIIRLFLVSAALRIWTFLLRVSDLISANKWLTIGFVNLLLLMAFLFISSRPVEPLRSALTAREITPLDISSEEFALIKNSGIPLYERYFLGSEYDSRSRILTHLNNSFNFGHVAIVRQMYISPNRSEILWAGAESIGFGQQDRPFNFLEQFIPAPKPQTNPAVINESFLRQAVFYTPLVFSVFQFLTLGLTYLSLRRKWAEKVQMDLTIEKLRLEIEILREERNKGTPQIVIARY